MQSMEGKSPEPQVELSKKKLLYKDYVDDNVEHKIIDSTIIISFGRKPASWINRMQLNEKQQLSYKLNSFGSVDRTYQAEAVPTAFRFSGSFEEFLESESGDAVESSIGKLVDDIPFDIAFSKYFNLLENNPGSTIAEEYLVQYFKEYPHHIPIVINRLNMIVSGLEEKEELLLWWAIGTSDTQDAHDQIINVAQDDTALESTRMRAISASHEFSNVSKRTVESMVSLTFDQNEEVSVMADLALGSILGNSDNESISAEILSYFELSLQSASNDQELIIALNALYNASNEETFVLAKDYINHPNSLVRGAAFNLIVNIPNSESLKFAFNNLDGSDVEVYDGVLRTLYPRKVEPYVNQWLVNSISSNNFFNLNESSKHLILDYVSSNIEQYSDNLNHLIELEDRINESDDLKILYSYFKPTI